MRDYLARRMRDMGLDVSASEGQLSPRALARLNRWSGQSKSQQSFYNVIGILRGTNPETPALLLMAHHDTVWGPQARPTTPLASRQYWRLRAR